MGAPSSASSSATRPSRCSGSPPRPLRPGRCPGDTSRPRNPGLWSHSDTSTRTKDNDIWAAAYQAAGRSVCLSTPSAVRRGNQRKGITVMSNMSNGGRRGFAAAALFAALLSASACGEQSGVVEDLGGAVPGRRAVAAGSVREGPGRRRAPRGAGSAARAVERAGPPAAPERAPLEHGLHHHLSIARVTTTRAMLLCAPALRRRGPASTRRLRLIRQRHRRCRRSRPPPRRRISD